jgi:hypothetical protein
MALFVLQPPAHTSPHTPFIGDPDTGLLHHCDCAARPTKGIAFRDRQTATMQGFAYCTCAAPPLVASTDRIRALLATTFPSTLTRGAGS